MRSSFLFRTLFLILSLYLFFGCSIHYRTGQELEAQNRWEEAAIEYRLAFVEDPDDEEVIQALERTNKKVAQENLERYQDYLKQGQFRKAYSRLEAASVQDPSLASARSELKLWTKVLLAGKVDFEFDRLQANIRLADQMQLQIELNTPSGKTIGADINDQTGFFFARRPAVSFLP